MTSSMKLRLSEAAGKIPQAVKDVINENETQPLRGLIVELIDLLNQAAGTQESEGLQMISDAHKQLQKMVAMKPR